MKKPFLLLIIFLMSFFVYSQTTHLGEQFCDAIIKRYQPSIDAMTHKGWDHSNSVVLHGIEKVFLNNKSQNYFDYIKVFVDTFIDKNNEIKGLKPELDRIHPGVLCLFLYEQTGDIKYKNAATNLKDYLIGTHVSASVFNTTPDGGFWHKNNDHYNNVMTIDGAYMSNPFLMKYGYLFNDKSCIDTAVFQTLLVASKTFNITNNLPYHGWDYNKQKSWSNSITGTSTEVWSRSIGWFSMALVDMLEYLPETHKDYTTMMNLYKKLAIGIKHVQNKDDGMWYQMMNYKSLNRNYPETSGSGMIIYALKKGVIKGWLDESYNGVVEKGWQGLKTFVSQNEDGMPQINSFNPGMGIKDNIKGYTDVRPVSCPSKDDKQHPHGYCAVLMAASVME